MLYDYHRTGLDEMFMSPDKGRAKITSTLDNLQKIYQADPMSVALSMFKDAKLDELVNIYSKGTAEERQHAYDVLSAIFPTEQQRLEKIRRGDQ